jgi:hypothetical protein
MPSDDRVAVACAAVRGSREAFRAALVATADQIRAFLAAQRGESASERAQRLAAELVRGGPGGRAKLALFHSTETRDPVASARSRLAHARPKARGLPSESAVLGGDLWTTWRSPTSAARSARRGFEASGGRRAGEAAAARTRSPPAVEPQRAPRGAARRDGGRRTCRRRVAGSSTVAEDRAGARRVRAAAGTPRPRTFVLQTVDGAGMTGSRRGGPASRHLIRGISPTIEVAPRHGNITRRSRSRAARLHRWIERPASRELRQLRQMAARPEAPVAPVPPPSAAMAGVTAAPGDPAGKLAAWLLAQADLDGMG